MEKEKQTKFKKWMWAFLAAAFVMVCIPAAARPVYAAKEKVTLTVLHYNGKTNSTYRKLSKTVDKGSLMVLPAVPKVKNYEGIGWSLKPNASSAQYKVGKRFYIKKDTTIYAVYKKYPCGVTFLDSKGKSSTAYKSLSVCVPRNYKLKLPEPPAVKGYEGVGWTTAKGKTTPLYKAGSRVSIKKSVRLYAVYKKSAYYTVNFYSTEGKTSSAYKRLSKKVPANSVLTLPSVPSRKGYANLGWSTKKNASTASKATRIRVTRNMNIYAVQKPGAQLVLHKQTGGVLKTYTLARGTTVKLPAVANSTKQVFLGWSTKKGQSSRPQYEAGDKVKISKDAHLYVVAYDRAREPDVSRTKIQTALSSALSRYKNIIFVGDSRTNRMRNVLENMGDSVTKRVSFVCAEGSGLEWLKTTGYKQLMKELQSGATGTRSKHTAIIFTHGGNDYYNINAYISYMKKLAPVLEKKNCELYYMSVNPVNSKTIENRGGRVRKEEYIRTFNSMIQGGLFGRYEFIDLYSKLVDNGYSTDSGNKYLSIPGDSGFDDGLHYSTKTYKRIYEYCLKYIAKY